MDLLKPSLNLFKVVALILVLRAIGIVVATVIVISGSNSNSNDGSNSMRNSIRSQFKRSPLISMNPYERICPPPMRFSPYHTQAEPEVRRGFVGQWIRKGTGG